MNRFISIFLLSSTLLLAIDSAYESGKNIYYAKACGNCHGTHAEGSSYYPRLAHKKASFLKEKLEKFKKGEADTQKQEIMFTFARALSDKDIADLVLFLSQYKEEERDQYDVEEDLLGVDF